MDALVGVFVAGGLGDVVAGPDDSRLGAVSCDDALSAIAKTIGGCFGSKVRGQADGVRNQRAGFFGHNWLGLRVTVAGCCCLDHPDHSLRDNRFYSL